MSKATPASPNRFERRRVATRQALIGAARQILAERGDGDVSIQQIAERADVGFGSFYNHFSSKAELFDAAVADALEEYGRVVDEVTRELEDPAEMLAAGVRLTAALVDSHPEVAQILRHRGLGQIYSGSGAGQRALRDLENGAGSGRFVLGDPLVALAAVGGTLLGLLELRVRHPEKAMAQAAAEVAELMLRMLGLPADEAGEIARRPLPPACG
jgi:AcrR family transcriptional regulator